MPSSPGNGFRSLAEDPVELDSIDGSTLLAGLPLRIWLMPW